MFLQFVFFMSGMLFVFRTSEKFERERLLDRRALTKIGIAYLLILISVTLFMRSTAERMSVMAATALFWLLPRLLTYHRNKKFRKSFVSFLNQLILQMNAGNSFRQSFEQTKNRFDPVIQSKLSEIIGFVAFSQQMDISPSQKFLREIIDELILVDQQPHRAILRLRSFRSKLKAAEDFRRKSGQITHQLRAQALIMTLLYFALATFMAVEFKLLAHWKIALASASLFAVGSFLVLLTGKRFRWKT